MNDVSSLEFPCVSQFKSIKFGAGLMQYLQDYDNFLIPYTYISLLSTTTAIIERMGCSLMSRASKSSIVLTISVGAQ